MALALWPHQSAVIDAAREALRAGAQSLVLALPTGAGKTRIAVEIVTRTIARGNRVLWLVHRAELVRQAHGALALAGVVAGIIAPWAESTDAPVQVASKATCVARELYPDAEIVVIDECHHTVATEYLALRQRYAQAVTIGLTATPARSDGVGLGTAFESLIAGPQPRELIASGHLVPVTVIAPAATRRTLAAHPVEVMRDHAGEQAIVFCASVAAARALAEEYTTAGMPAACVDGETDDDVRVEMIDQFRAGDLRVLTNFHVLTEGFDAPSASVCILARTIGSAPVYVQACGRVMRSAPGKARAIVYDLCGSSIDLGLLPDSDRVYSLEGAGVSGAKQIEAVRQCKSCGRVFESKKWGRAGCPACGFLDERPPDPKVVKRHMEELKAAHVARCMATQSGENRIEFLRREVAKCRARGHKLGKALFAFRGQFGRYPYKLERQAAGC